ncbi:hypothetical protein ACFWVU_30295 [Streptomyces sp. NPDC058686]|uniref:hypothetical protein n=1 Tax=Streptomyces sp. NPDC058686 TaxID=3346599 RepID=UPI0036633A6A
MAARFSVRLKRGLPMVWQWLFDDKDASGKVTISVFLDRAPTVTNHHYNVPCAVPGDMVVVGGGASGTDAPAGALLTASYPSADRSAWLASSADHRVANPHRLEVYAIGMKINGMSRDELLRNVHYGQMESSVRSHPSAQILRPDGYTLISGGFCVNGPGNFAICDFPTAGSYWTAISKDHINPSPCTITVFSVSLRTNLPNVGTVECVQRSQYSEQAGHPSATVLLPPEYAVTGIGAETYSTETAPGQMLWHIRPIVAGTTGARASSKDHIQPSPGRISAFALGTRIV